MEQRLRIENLHIGYTTGGNTHTVIPNLSFEVESGTLISIIGRNGSGKTTLLQSIAQLLAVLQGKIYWNDTDLKPLSTQAKAKLISFVGQIPNIPAHLKLQDLLALSRNPYTNWLGNLEQSDRSQIQIVADRLDLIPWLDRPLVELSAGQKQRCLIAAALVQDTPILLLDEPSAFLDLDHKASIFKLLQEIAHKHNKIVMLSTHDLNPALQISDKILLLDKGQGTFGSVQELVRQKIFENIFHQKWVGFDPDLMQFSICV